MDEATKKPKVRNEELREILAASVFMDRPVLWDTAASMADELLRMRKVVVDTYLSLQGKVLFPLQFVEEYTRCRVLVESDNE